MRKFTTTIYAIDPKTNELTTWAGPYIDAISWTLAEEYCQLNGLGYCFVTGELVAEIPCKEDGTADFKKMIDYETINLN